MVVITWCNVTFCINTELEWFSGVDLGAWCLHLLIRKNQYISLVDSFAVTGNYSKVIFCYQFKVYFLIN